MTQPDTKHNLDISASYKSMTPSDTKHNFDIYQLLHGW